MAPKHFLVGVPAYRLSRKLLRFLEGDTVSLIHSVFASLSPIVPRGLWRACIHCNNLQAALAIYIT